LEHVSERNIVLETKILFFLWILERFSMVKMNIHPESEDLQISKLNEFFLVVDRIRKAGHSARQGFDKFKNKTNPNGGGARLSVPSSGENAPFTNGSFTSVASIV